MSIARLVASASCYITLVINLLFDIIVDHNALQEILIKAINYKKRDSPTESETPQPHKKAIAMADKDRSLARLAEIRKRFWRVTNIDARQTDEQQNGFQFTIPGFKFDDFDRFGHPSHHKIVRIFETGRFIRGFDFGSSLGAKTVDAVMLGYDIEILRELYEHAAVNYPMNVKRHITHVGKSSFSLAQQITDARTGNLLVRRSMTAVNVDLTGNNLKPLPLTDAFREKFRNNEDRSPAPQMLNPITSIPERRFTCNIVVRVDETDLFGHTTQASYTMYLVECALQANMAKFLSVVNDFSLLHRAKLRFMRESYAGDKLTLATWEDANNPLIIKVVITRVEDGRDSCYAEMEYYPSALTSHL